MMGLFDNNDYVFLATGDVLQTHPETACVGSDACSIHRPSNHPLREAPQLWFSSRYMVVRICAHDRWHPDVDDLDFKRRRVGGPRFDALGLGVHDCDGCCYWPTEDEDDVR